MSAISNSHSLDEAFYVKHVTIISVFTVLACVAVALRFWARRIQNMSLELDDHLIVLGLLFALGESAINIYGCCFGIKQQSQENLMNAISFSQKAGFIGPLIWVFSVTFVRASIALLYIHVFPTRLFRRICYLFLVVNLIFSIGTILGFCLICRPLSYRWDRLTGGKGVCGDQKILDLFVGIFNLFLDATTVVLPMPVLWGLKMAVAKKVMLSAMFGMGTTICALTAYRIYVSSKISASNSAGPYAVIALLTSLEALLGVINACLPVLKPVYNKMRRAAAPQNGKQQKRSGINEILKSGTIPVFMHVSQMLTMVSKRSGKGSLNGEETSFTETSGWYEEEKKKKEKKEKKKGSPGGSEASVTTEETEVSPSVGSKADRVMGVKTHQIHVRKDVDVESVASRDEREGFGGRWEGRQERW